VHLRFRHKKPGVILLHRCPVESEHGRGRASFLHEHDLKTIATFSKKDALLSAMATHAGVTEEDFAAAVDRWFASAKHPKLGRAFTDCAYRPQRAAAFGIQVVGMKANWQTIF
jgi:hypothetical protein